MKIRETLSGSTPIRRPVTGRYIVVKSADAEINVRGVGIEDVYLGAGEQYDLGEYFSSKEIYIQSTISGSNNFEIEVTRFPLVKSNQNNMTVNTTAVVENGNDNQHLPKVSVAAGASVAICTANTDRKFLRIALLSDAAGYVIMGKSGVDATGGGTLEPGMIDYIETTGALWVFNPQAVAVDVWIMEVNKI